VASFHSIAFKDMNKRPDAVSIICWIIIVMASISFTSLPAMTKSPVAQEEIAKSAVPAGIQLLMIIAGSVISCFSAIFMLCGANWARWLYVVGGGLCLLTSLLISSSKAMVIPGIPLYCIAVVLLFRSESSTYFKAKQPPEDSNRDE
jgi:hypothetical protein